ncbi:hypothetical protein MUK42_05199 [Musa troglodytarum]|uniref:Uncharacterized protein n=1 Tax=Musa troglodytarum TaxID=320322 RepID=A0A9E7ENE1_9LILI|nr:hypothetical protein MUK42_05199 [Musa troglodytarum]
MPLVFNLVGKTKEVLLCGGQCKVHARRGGTTSRSYCMRSAETLGSVTGSGTSGPKFLDKFPGITKRLNRPAVALVSTDGPWMTFKASPSYERLFDLGGNVVYTY